MKILTSLPFKVLGIIISVFGIAKGVLSDGIIGWGLLALPFIPLLCISLPISYKKRMTFCVIVMIIVVGGWELKHYSSLVYEPVGQEVRLIADMPIVSYRSGGDLYFDLDPEDSLKCIDILGSCPKKVRSIIPKGTVFHVRNIETYVQDFGRAHLFVLQNDTQILRVYPWIHADGSICEKVEWDFCKQKIGPIMKEPFFSFSYFLY